jgi:hypothetical protein
MSDDLEGRLSRQQMIWAGMYGPARADDMVAEARRRLDADPGLDVAAVVAALDPDDDDDDDAAGLSRPGVG